MASVMLLYLCLFSILLSVYGFLPGILMLLPVCHALVLVLLSAAWLLLLCLIAPGFFLCCSDSFVLAISSLVHGITL